MHLKTRSAQPWILSILPNELTNHFNLIRNSRLRHYSFDFPIGRPSKSQPLIV